MPNEMEPGSGVCPICGESNKTTQIYKMYSDLINGSHPQEVQGIAKKQLTIMVSPPTIVKSDGLSSLHPDLLALIFLLFLHICSPFNWLKKVHIHLFMVWVLEFLLIGYWLFRQKLMAKYNQNKHDREKLISEFRVKADIWMEMVYCKKDDLVFTPDHKVQLKLDQLKRILAQTDQRSRITSSKPVQGADLHSTDPNFPM